MDELNQNMPYKGVVFHYCSWQTFKSIIETKTIRLSDSAQMNDSVEARWFLILLEERLRKVATEENKVSLTQAWDFLLKTIPRLYLASFSKKLDDLNMFRSYGDDGCGVCIGFNSEYFDINRGAPSTTAAGPKSGSAFVSMGISEVIYEEKRIDALLDLFEGLVKRFGEELAGKAERSGIEINLQAWLSHACCRIKNKMFSEEQEVRISHSILMLSRKDGGKPIAMGGVSDLKFMDTRHGIKSFLELPFEEKKSVSPISKIILGPKSQCSIDTLQLFLEYNEMWGVNKIERSRAPYR